MDELSALRYCLTVLQKRIVEKHSNLWLWKIKKKIATFCVSLLIRKHEREPFEANELTPVEKEFIVKTHPLLDMSSAISRDLLYHKHSEWFASIRQKIDFFLHKPDEYYIDTNEFLPLKEES